MANDIKQKITIDNKEYIKGIHDGKEALNDATTNANKQLTENSKVFAQNEKQVKTWSQTMQEEFKKFKKSFTENLATGAKAITLDAGVHALHKSAEDAVEMMADADQKFAEFKSRVSASDDQLKKWKDSIARTAIDTKTNLASMEDAFMSLSDSADPEQITKFMKQIGDATLLAHGNQGAVTDFVKGSLTGQGKEFNQENVEGALTAADVLRRKGRGFGTMEQSMSALGGLDQQSIKSSGLSEKNIAALLAGASRSMSAGQASAGIGALLEANKNGLQQGSVLAGIVGASGRHALSGANGQLDVSKLANQGSFNRLMAMGGGDEKKAMEVFRAISGMGPEASDALFKMIKNFKDFNSTVADANADQKKLGTSAEQAGDNIKAMYQQMQDKLVVGFEDIFDPIKGPLKALLGGHPGDAAMGIPGAISGALKGAMEHPLLVGGALLGTAAGGMLLKGVLGKVMGGGGGAVELAKGTAIGKALQAAGITPVYVVNHAEIGHDAQMTPSAISGMFGGGAAGGLGGAAGKLGRAGTFLKGAGGVFAAAEVGMAIGGVINDIDAAHSSKNKFGQDFSPLEKGLAKVIPEWAGGMTKQQYKDNYTEQKVIVEIHSTDGRFDAKPKASDNPTDGKVQ
jgi:hypothetical protein